MFLLIRVAIGRWFYARKIRPAHAKQNGPSFSDGDNDRASFFKNPSLCFWSEFECANRHDDFRCRLMRLSDSLALGQPNLEHICSPFNQCRHGWPDISAFLVLNRLLLAKL